jgi:hypothetical protein
MSLTVKICWLWRESVAFDASLTVETPFGKRDKILGGAGTHFSLSASFFTGVNVVGVVGSDFGDAEWAVFERHNINTDDIEVVADGKTFFWRGRYDYDMNTAHTLDTQLNVFETFDPKLSENSKSARLLFLANILPTIQKQVREQCADAEFVAMDTMNFWISSMKEQLIETIKVVDCRDYQRRRSAAVDRRAEHSQSREKNYGLRLENARHQTRRIRRGFVYRRQILFRRSGVSARIGFRPDRRGRHVRGRIYGLSREQVEITKTRCAAR